MENPVNLSISEIRTRTPQREYIPLGSGDTIGSSCGDIGPPRPQYHPQAGSDDAESTRTPGLAHTKMDIAFSDFYEVAKGAVIQVRHATSEGPCD